MLNAIFRRNFWWRFLRVITGRHCMLTANQIIKRLDPNAKKLYVRVKGFGVQEVNDDVSTIIVKMNACQVPGRDSVMVNNPTYDKVESIEWASDGFRGFRVEEIVPYKDGLLMVFVF